MTRLFIYGTLKRGECRAHHMLGQRYVGEARTAPRYRMVHCGSYPGLVDVGEERGRAIEGELWQVDAEGLKRLDIVEGTVEHLFERRAVALADHDGSVEAYYFAGEVRSLPDAGTCW